MERSPQPAILKLEWPQQASSESRQPMPPSTRAIPSRWLRSSGPTPSGAASNTASSGGGGRRADKGLKRPGRSSSNNKNRRPNGPATPDSELTSSSKPLSARSSSASTGPLRMEAEAICSSSSSSPSTTDTLGTSTTTGTKSTPSRPPASPDHSRSQRRGVERLWSLAVATGGNGWQMPGAKSARSSETVAVGCHQLRPLLQVRRGSPSLLRKGRHVPRIREVAAKCLPRATARAAAPVPRFRRKVR
jgi:hypothetical protein